MGNADQMNEIFDRIQAGKTKDERRHLFEAALRKHPNIAWYMKMAFDPDFKITGVPEGIPTGPKGRTLIDRDIPRGMGYTMLEQETRRFLLWGPKGPFLKETPERRAWKWARQIEGLHWEEVDLITAIKDGKIHTMYPFTLEVLSLVPGLKLPDPAND